MAELSTIRPYQPADRQGVIEVFRRNTPEFFDTNEQLDLEKYLDAHWNTYFVMEEKGKIIGCGGYYFEKDGITGRLSWDFFDPRYKGRGLGRQMINHCLEELRKNPHLEKTEVWTSQLAWQFYAKFGFETQEVKEDFWGPGLNLYRMEM
ncbi:MAG: GNAT family N-acetyltransferase [Cyclobacteriaceae bacterium]|nr:GNAT family N-acetyltransferase [Cyclobacteriaceae bacterium]